MLNVAIIVGSTRPGRKADAVAQWVHGLAARRSDAVFEVVDIAAFNLPLLDEPMPPTWANIPSPIPRPGRRRSHPSTLSSSSLPNTTTASPAR
jgi:NAD(P)H-dependent FMN reductase